MSGATLQPFLKEELERRITSAGLVMEGPTFETVDRVRALGFRNSANVRLIEAAEVASMRGLEGRKEHYEHVYPLCQWVSWDFLQQFCAALDLHVDTADHYTGVVPGEQLPYMEMASVEANDLPEVHDLLKLSGVDASWLAAFSMILGVQMKESWKYDDGTLVARYTSVTGRSEALRRAWRSLRDDLFVVGPRDVFDQPKDWREIGQDPLVFRAVRGGALIVAAWGAEGDAIREALADRPLNTQEDQTE